MNIEELVFASGNAGKLEEVQAYFASLSIEVLPQDKAIGSAEETGLTFVENALLKARYVAEHTHLPVLADDSGLVVPALGGQPGIYSARYAGKQASSKENIARLIDEMQQFEAAERDAYFYCSLVMLRSPKDPAPLIAVGQWSGRILYKAQGEGGFGYDPIFQPDNVSGSAAQLSLKAKNQISHRAQALRHIVECFNQG